MSNHNQAPQPMQLDQIAEQADQIAEQADQIAEQAMLHQVATFAQDPANAYASGPDIRKGTGLSQEEIMSHGGYNKLKDYAIDFQTTQLNEAYKTNDAHNAAQYDEAAKMNKAHDRMVESRGRSAEGKKAADAWKSEVNGYRTAKSEADKAVEVNNFRAKLAGFGEAGLNRNPDLKAATKKNAIDKATADGFNTAHLQPSEGLKVPRNLAAEQRSSDMVAAIKSHERQLRTAKPMDEALKMNEQFDAERERTMLATHEEALQVNEAFDRSMPKTASPDKVGDSANDILDGLFQNALERRRGNGKLLDRFRGRGSSPEAAGSTVPRRRRLVAAVGAVAALFTFGALNSHNGGNEADASASPRITVENATSALSTLQYDKLGQQDLKEKSSDAVTTPVMTPSTYYLDQGSSIWRHVEKELKDKGNAHPSDKLIGSITNATLALNGISPEQAHRLQTSDEIKKPQS